MIWVPSTLFDLNEVDFSISRPPGTHKAAAYQSLIQSGNSRLSCWWFSKSSRLLSHGAILLPLVLRDWGGNYPNQISGICVG